MPFNTLPNAPRPISSWKITCSRRISHCIRGIIVDLDLNEENKEIKTTTTVFIVASNALQITFCLFCF